MPAIGQLVRRGINYAETVSGLVSWGAIFIDSGRHSWRTTQRYKNSLSVQRGVNPAWPFANAKSRNHFVRRAVNYCDVARVFIADKDEVARRFTAGQNCACDNDAKDKKATHG